MVLSEEEIKTACDALDRIHTALVDLLHIFKDRLFNE